VGTLVATFAVREGRTLDALREVVEELVAEVPRVVLVPVVSVPDTTVWTQLRAAGAQVLPWAAGDALGTALGARSLDPVGVV
jgi:hypothetical protein